MVSPSNPRPRSPSTSQSKWPMPPALPWLRADPKAAKSSAVSLDHLLGMLARRLCELRPAQHARYFLCALLASHRANAGTRPPPGFLLLDHVVMISKSRDLRQMRHAQHLIRPRQRLQLLAHRLRRPPPNPSVNLVEHQSPLGAPFLAHFARKPALSLSKGGDFRATQVLGTPPFAFFAKCGIRSRLDASLQRQHHPR